MSKEQKKREDGFEHLEEALTSGEQFIEKNQKMIVNVVLVLVVIIAGYFGYNRFIAEPHAQEAANQIFGAQNYFEKDSFNLALNGDGNVLGFIEIADKYSSTPSGNLAKYYAGLSYLYMGEYQNAIQYLEKFSSDDEIAAAEARMWLNKSLNHELSMRGLEQDGEKELFHNFINIPADNPFAYCLTAIGFLDFGYAPLAK